jgi:hypothetical protein
MFETLGNKGRSLYVFIGILILFSGIINIEMQYVTAGHDGIQLDPFEQGGESLGSGDGGAGNGSEGSEDLG